MRLAFPIPALVCALGFSCAFAQTDSTGSTGSTGSRNQRNWGISGEIGMNSLSSLIGPVITYYALPNLPADFGVGLSSSGLRPGVRGRYLFTPNDKASFFGGLGLKYGMGSGDQEAKVKDADTQEELKLQTKPTVFLDFMIGLEFLANNGFLLIANGGYSQLLTDDPYKVTSGTPSEQGKDVLDLVFGSGILLSVSVGKAF